MLKSAIAALGAVFLLSAAPVFAQGSVGPVRGDYLPPLGLGAFNDGTWQGYEQEGWFVLQNSTDPTSIHYFQMSMLPDSGEMTLRANVYARNDDGEGIAASGLLFDFGEENSTYIAFLLTADNQLMAINRDIGDMDVLHAEPNDPRGRGDGSDVLEVRISGTRAQMYLNDQLFRNYDLTHRPFHPRAGIIALGTGRLGFWGLSAQ